VTPDTVSDLLVTQAEAQSRLQARLDLIADVQSGNLDHVTWYDGTMTEIGAIFASRAREYFSKECGFSFAYVMNRGRQLRGANLDRTVGILKRMIAGLQDAKDHVGSEPSAVQSKKVFIVHGHDEALLLQVKEVLTSQSLTPVILKDEPNGGSTIIEKFERNSDVGFAVVLLTADDVGHSKLAVSSIQPRARQNVILELGYFIGRLGRARICALNEEGVELPSDFHGVIYIPLDNGGAWRSKLLDELKHAGYSIDKNKI
jgi:predicted nucleotide-binding protein